MPDCRGFSRDLSRAIPPKVWTVPTHRVAIANRRLLSLDEDGVTFRYKDYRRDGAPNAIAR